MINSAAALIPNSLRVLYLLACLNYNLISLKGYKHQPHCSNNTCNSHGHKIRKVHCPVWIRMHCPQPCTYQCKYQSQLDYCNNISCLTSFRCSLKIDVCKCSNGCNGYNLLQGNYAQN